MMDSSPSSALPVTRPLGQQELGFLAMYNLGIHRSCACSVKYTNPQLSFESGCAAIQSALAIIMERVPALSSVVAFDDDTKTHVIRQTARPPLPEIQLCDGIDLDVESSSYREWRVKALDEPIDVRDPERPPWRVFILRADAKMSHGFDVRVEFVYSHVFLDGLCGPFFHEILSELLSDPEHVYRTNRPVYLPTQVSMLSLESIWDYKALARLQQWSLARCLRPLTHIVCTAYDILRQLWMPAKAYPFHHTVMRTISINRDDMQRLLVESRGHDVTLTNVMHACVGWALASAQAAVSPPFGDDPIPLELLTAITLRPGYPGAQGLIPGIEFGPATRLDAILPRNSAFRHLFLCAVSGLGGTVKVAPSLNFWDLCRENRRLLTDHGSRLQKMANKAASLPVLDWGHYQRRLLAATSAGWEKSGLSPRVLTGLEGHRLASATADLKHPMHILTNSGMSQLSQGAGWTSDGLSWGVNTRETPDMITTVGACASGIVLNTVYCPSVCSDEKAEVFVRVLKESILAVAKGRVLDEGTLGHLVSTE